MQLEHDFNYRDISVSRDGHLLTIENAALRRVFDLTNVVPRTISLFNKVTGREHALTGDASGDFSFIGFNMPESEALTTEYRSAGIAVDIALGDYLDGEHVEVCLRIEEKVQQLVFCRTYCIYPGLAVISSFTAVMATVVPNVYWNRRGQLNGHLAVGMLESRGDSISLASGLRPVKTVEFRGRTDFDNDLLLPHAVDQEQMNGNLLFAADESSGAGLLILQEAPPSRERRDFETYDFRITGNTVRSCCWGIPPQEIEPGRELKSYRHTVMLYQGDEDYGCAVLKQYLKTRFPADPKEVCSVMVNPWGCGQFPELVSEAFLIEEFKAAGKLNATHYQIDDGWQAGKALRELNNNNRYPGQDYWQINLELLPNGFEPIIAAADEAGVEPALWVAPSSNMEYRDWEYFADWLYDYYLRYGFRFFKIDFVRIRSKEGEDNLENLLLTLRRRSNGDIYFNLDTTNGQRPGYFLFLEYGNIFLENRYACREWGQVYHPEITLNNLWRLSRYCRAQMLQIEFTDPDNINYDYFHSKGINPPDEYDAEYWAGVAMFANPLLWFAPSRLKPAAAAAFAEVMRLHRRYAHEIFAGEIYPVGEEPSGRALTGMQSHDRATGFGMFIVYREKGASAEGNLPLLFLDTVTRYRLTRLSNQGEEPAGEFSGATVAVELSRPGSWQLFRYQPASRT